MNTNIEKYGINYVINENGKNGKFSFSAAKKHFTSGLYRKIMEVEGRTMQKKKNEVLLGVAQERHYKLDRNELQNKAFLTCRTALQKGKLPKGYKERDIKAICFDATFLPTLEKCECRAGYKVDVLLKKVSIALAKNAKKNNKK